MAREAERDGRPLCELGHAHRGGDLDLMHDAAANEAAQRQRQRRCATTDKQHHLAVRNRVFVGERLALGDQTRALWCDAVGASQRGFYLAAVFKSFSEAELSSAVLDKSWHGFSSKMLDN